MASRRSMSPSLYSDDEDEYLPSHQPVYPQQLSFDAEPAAPDSTTGLYYQQYIEPSPGGTSSLSPQLDDSQGRNPRKVQFNLDDTLPDFTLPVSSSGCDIRTPSISKANVLKRAREQTVVLEDLQKAQSCCTVRGLVRIAFHSLPGRVTVRYTADSWKTQRDVEAKFIRYGADRGTSQYCFIVDVATLCFRGGWLELAVKYEVGGEEYWDNNSGKNYSVEVFKSDVHESQGQLEPRLASSPISQPESARRSSPQELGRTGLCGSPVSPPVPNPCLSRQGTFEDSPIPIMKGRKYRIPAGCYTLNSPAGASPALRKSPPNQRCPENLNYTSPGVEEKKREKLPTARPREYNGDCAWEDYWKHFGNVVKVNQWAEDTALNYLLLSLHGSALQYANSLPREINASLEGVRTAMSQRFGASRGAAMHRAELQRLVRRPNQSLPALAQDVRRLVKLAHPDFDVAAQEYVAVDAFYDALPDEKQRNLVYNSRPTTLEEAVDAALHAEAYSLREERRTGKSRSGVRTVESSDKSRDPGIQRDLQEVKRSLNELKQRMDQGNHNDNAFRFGNAGTRDDRQNWRNGASQSNGQKPPEPYRPPLRQGKNESDSLNQGRNNQPGQAEPPVEAARQVDCVSSEENDLTVEVEVSFGHHRAGTVRFLVDTGASVSILSTTLFKEKLPGIELSTTDKRLRGASGEELAVWGEKLFQLKVEGKRLHHTLVVAEITEQGIIGLDFLRKYRCAWDWNSGRLGIFGVRPYSSMPLPVRLPSNREIPAMAECIILGELRNGLRAPLVGVVTGEKTLWKRYGVLVASTVVQRHGSSVGIRVLNPQEHPVTLTAGEVVARFQTIEEDAVVPLLPESTVEEHKVRAISAQEAPLPIEVQEAIQALPAELMEEQRTAVKDLLVAYADVFASKSKPLGRTRLTQHFINTGNAAPIRQRPRREPIAFRGQADEEIKKMLNDGVIEPSDSPWASPTVLVRKKDGSVRFCVDYRRLNDVTIKDAYPLPHIETSLERLQGASWFSTIDLASGYWQVEVNPEDRAKTAFCTPNNGLFQFQVMPFGLANAPATFERLMERILVGLRWEVALIYLDDCVIHSTDFEQHLINLQLVLQRLRAAGLQIKGKKCSFLQRRVNFLGHIVSEAGIEVDPEKTAKVADWPQPTTVKGVQSFLGLAGYYRRFVEGYAEIAAPLTKLTRKQQEFEWEAEQQLAFDCLKKKLTQAPILGYPWEDADFILDTDASDYAVGGVLSQIQEGQERVVCYGSKLLDAAERNYCVTRRELLAVVYFCQQFRHYLLGRKFTVRTDHGSLRWLFNFREPEGQLARWLERLSRYEFEIIHRPGRQHGNADALSRITATSCCRQCGREECQGSPFRCKSVAKEVSTASPGDRTAGGLETHQHPANPSSQQTGIRVGDLTDRARTAALTIAIGKTENTRDQEKLSTAVNSSEGKVKVISSAERQSQASGNVEGQTPAREEEVASENPCGELPCTEDIQNAQADDPVLQKLKTFEEKPPYGAIAGESAELKYYWSRWTQLHWNDDGLLYFRWQEATGHYRMKLVVPAPWRRPILSHFHGSPLGSHFGVSRTHARLQASFFIWPQQRTSVEKWIASCDTCAKCKAPLRRRRAPLKNVAAGTPLERMCSDIVGPLPETPRGNQYILVVTDVFSKWTECFPLPNHHADTVGETLLNEVFLRVGIPRALHTDQGREYESHLFQQLCSRLGIEKTRTTPWRPQSDGQCERFNRTMEGLLRTVVAEDQKDWDLHLPAIVSAYRATVHESTGATPNKLMFGRELPMPLEICFGAAPGDEPPAQNEYVDRQMETLTHAHQLARTHLQKARERQKKQYDKRAFGERLQRGNYVWLHNPTKHIGRSPKLETFYEEKPYVVLQMISDVVAKIQRDPRIKPRIVHVDHLLPVRGNISIPWWEERLRREEPAVRQQPVATNVAEPEDASEDEVGQQEPDQNNGDCTTRAGRTSRPPVPYSP